MFVTSYDSDADAAYLRMKPGKVHRTVELDQLTLVDLDNGGEVVGVEIIHPGRPWPLADLLDQFPLSDEDRKMLQKMFGASYFHFPVDHQISSFVNA